MSRRPRAPKFDGWGMALSRPVAGSPCASGTLGACALVAPASGSVQVDAEISLLPQHVTILNPDRVHGEVLSTPFGNGIVLACGMSAIQHRPDACTADYPYGMWLTILAGFVAPITSAEIPCGVHRSGPIGGCCRAPLHGVR